MTAKKAKYHAVNEVNVGVKGGGVKTFRPGAPIDIDLSEDDAQAMLKSKSIETADDFNARADREAERAARRDEAAALNRGEGVPDQRRFTGREVPGMTKKEEKAAAAQAADSSSTSTAGSAGSAANKP